MMAIAEGYDQLAKMAEQLKLVTGPTGSSSQASGGDQRNALLANCRL
jgi:hypothetical protein